MKTLLCTVALVGFTAGAAAAQNNADSQMLALTQSVLQGINGGSEPASQSEQTPDLSSLIAQAMEEGENDEYLEALISAAVETGSVEVPEAMVSTDGNVDTKTLLASLVSQSLGNSSETSAVVPAALVSEATGASEEKAEPRRYTVESGDSLAAIALRYYGDASEFEKIFVANRSTIKRPNMIKVGQVILIP